MPDGSSEPGPMVLRVLGFRDDDLSVSVRSGFRVVQERKRSVVLRIVIGLAACLALAAGPAAYAGQEAAAPVRAQRLGFSLGTPAAFNFVGTVDLPFTTISASGMYWGDPKEQVAGVQLGASLVRSERTKTFQALNLIVGTSEIENDEWTYWGVEGMFSWEYFFVQPAITGGRGDYTSPQFGLQLGVLWTL